MIQTIEIKVSAGHAPALRAMLEEFLAGVRMPRRSAVLMPHDPTKDTGSDEAPASMGRCRDILNVIGGGVAVRP